VVDRDLREVFEGAVNIPVKSAQLQERASGSSCRAPRAKHGARAFGDFTDHVNTEYFMVIGAGSIGHTAHFFVKVTASVLFGQLVGAKESS
jgi:hypothetical protein